MEEKLKQAIKAEENFDFLNAVKIYQEIENQLEDELVLSRYAQLLIEFQDYEKAEIIYDKLLKIDSTNKEYNLTYT